MDCHSIALLILKNGIMETILWNRPRRSNLIAYAEWGLYYRPDDDTVVMFNHFTNTTVLWNRHRSQFGGALFQAITGKIE